MKRIALRIPDGAVWTGGVNYLVNICRVLLQNADAGYEPVVFASPAVDPALRAELTELLGPRLVIDSLVPAPRSRGGLLSALLLGRNRSMLELCRRHHCDVVFEAADFWGWRFPVACLGWVPDFQDRHLPQLFSPVWRARRKLGLWAQILARRTILLSSRDAEADCRRFFASPKLRTCVAPFAVRPSVQPGDNDPTLAVRFGLPERYFYLPNQYWKHKNHVVVIDALAALRERGIDLVVASSGNPNDPRHKEHFAELQQRVTAANLGDNFRFLGVVSGRDVGLLMRTSVAVVNPSLFEGWSTTVEEAKSLGCRLVLSDLAVHREQAGEQVLYFDPASVRSTADALAHAWRLWAEPVSMADQQRAAEAAEARIRTFALQFAAACDAALEWFGQRS